MRFIEELRKLVEALCADDIEYLLEYLPTIETSKYSNHDVIKRERINLSCPNCESFRIVKNGKTKGNRQKYYL